eukprot:TRINITY_DN5729_c0_g2_i3.p4 TRINITY_DN5729_c0_g2~~TRINITY_DN5729_c0_g2_i3.p4  ORF type:complete len:114 (-),score=5.55 TRINITY_DN5729_c0_g2_i3:318-659(-)
MSSKGEELQEHPVVAARRKVYSNYDLSRKRRPIPFPILAGCVLTTGALLMQFASFAKGDSHALQFWMRMRLLGHGATVTLIMAGFSGYLFKSYFGENGFVDKFILQKEAKQPE